MVVSDHPLNHFVLNPENILAHQKVIEAVTARNTADALAHSTKKALEEHGAGLEAAEKEAIEAALKELDEAIKGSDKAAIEAKTEALGKASQKLGEKAMAAEQAKAAAAAPGAAPGGAQAAAPDADVVDADFKEVDDKK